MTDPGPNPDTVALDQIARIQVGEVEGKRSLRRIAVPERSADASSAVHPVLTGDSPRGPTRQACPTHDLGHAPRKSADRYAAPKVLIVKTGRSLRVGLDRRGYAALQSLYCLHVLPAARREGWTEARLARALAEPAVSDRFIRPHTEAKELFPQITITMLRQVMLPRRPS